MYKTYYHTMLEKGRLMPFIVGDNLIGFVSFYITNDVDKYIRDDPWTVLDDEPETGKICYVDQVWVKEEYRCFKHSFEIWKRLKRFLRFKYSQVEFIRWNRWKNDKPYEFNVKI